METVSKDKRRNKNKLEKQLKNNPYSTPAGKITAEQYAAIVKNRLANRPVLVWRYPNGKWNKKFIITLVIVFVAMIAALYFLTITTRPM
jgi:hypothetical protein